MAEGLGQAVGPQRGASGRFRLRKAKRHLALGPSELDSLVFQLLDSGLPGSGPLCHLLGTALEAANPGFQLGDSLVLMLALPNPLLVTLLSFLEIVAVVAAERLDLTPGDGEHGGDRLVEERKVVAHQQQTSLIRGKERHQPGFGVDIEVIGRLVEQQDIGLGEQDARQLNSSALPPGHGDDRMVQLGAGDADGMTEALGFGLGDIAAACHELVLEVGKPPDEPVSFGCGGVLHAQPSAFHLTLERADVAGHEDALQGAGLGVGKLSEGGLLRQIPHDSAAGHRSLVGRAPPRQRAQQRGLPGPVRPNQADLVSGVHGKRRVRDQTARPSFDGEAASEEHDTSKRGEGAMDARWPGGLALSAGLERRPVAA